MSIYKLVLSIKNFNSNISINTDKIVKVNDLPVFTKTIKINKPFSLSEYEENCEVCEITCGFKLDKICFYCKRKYCNLCEKYISSKQKIKLCCRKCFNDLYIKCGGCYTDYPELETKWYECSECGVNECKKCITKIFNNEFKEIRNNEPIYEEKKYYFCKKCINHEECYCCFTIKKYNELEECELCDGLFCEGCLIDKNNYALCEKCYKQQCKVMSQSF